MYTIALVEDELAIAQNYRDAFVRLGYKVTLYNNRQSAMDAFTPKDLVTSDIEVTFELSGALVETGAYIDLNSYTTDATHKINSALNYYNETFNTKEND